MNIKIFIDNNCSKFSKRSQELFFFKFNTKESQKKPIRNLYYTCNDGEELIPMLRN